MWPAVVLGAGLRASDPPRRRAGAGRARAGPRPLRARPRAIATCSWSAPARPGSPPRSPPARAARASCWPTSGRTSAARLPSSAGRSAASRPASGSRAPTRELGARCRRSASSGAPACSATTTTTSWARSSASPTTCRRAARHAPRQRLLDDPRPAGRARDRGAGAAAGVRRQRPAGRHARVRGARLCERLRRGRPAGASSSPPTTTTLTGPRSTLTPPGSRSRRSSIAAREPGALADRARDAGIEVRTGSVVRRARGRLEVRGVELATTRRRGARSARVRSGRDVRRLESGGASVQPVRARGRCGRRRSPPSFPARRARPSARRGRRAACSIWPAASPMALRAGAEAAAAAGFRAHAATAAAGCRRARGGAACSRSGGSAAAGARRSSTSRTTSPPTTSASPRARATSRSSTPSATPRSAWRPIRARPRTSTGSRFWPRRAAIRSPRSASPPSGPPYTPVAIGSFAGHERGRHYQPVRRTAIHAWHERRGAVFVEAGRGCGRNTTREGGEDVAAATVREALAVRRAVGLCDVSTLGKIDLQGPDAAAFLDRLYVNVLLRRSPVGRARYGLMLREDGIVFDDGTTSRLGEHHFLMTTTTANAAAVLAHMEFYAQTVWPELDVQLLLGHRAVGRHRARRARERATCWRGSSTASMSSNEALPYMGVAETTIRGVRARIFRISFSGRARLRDQRAGRLWRGGLGAADGCRRRVRHRALRHGGARRAAHREGPRRRPRAGWPHHRPRSRSRPHAQHAQGLHRPEADGAARPGRSQAAGSGRADAGRARMRACAAAPTWSRIRSARAARPASAT